jgi:hypothetical protein
MKTKASLKESSSCGRRGPLSKITRSNQEHRLDLGFVLSRDGGGAKVITAKDKKGRLETKGLVMGGHQLSDEEYVGE